MCIVLRGEYQLEGETKSKILRGDDGLMNV